ncbi:hypothetical protein [Falsiroseomonas sp.]|uniref:hypothetical protein n=1 Tax=Falsiroseomonas sp. TaxID=2870721 RepID=UPI00272B4091|nr:hypothetical protein [Falsiroseomonas sp.]
MQSTRAAEDHSTGFCTWCLAALVWYLARTENTAAQRHLAALAGGARLGWSGTSPAPRIQQLSAVWRRWPAVRVSAALAFRTQ